MKRMRRRLAFVTNPLDSAFKSSISIIILELAKRLKSEFDITVYTSRGGTKIDPPGLVVRRLSAAPDSFMRRFTGKLRPLYTLKRPFFSSFLYYPSYSVQLALDLRRLGPDIVHINNFSQFAPVVKALNPGMKLVLHTHNEWLAQLDRETMETRLAKTDLVVCCSDYITSRTRDAFPAHSARVRTLHNGVDYARFSQVRPQDGDRRLICVGRISPEKGLHVIIEAFNIIAPRHPGLELHLIGQERITPREFLVDLSDEQTVRSLAAFYPGSYQKKISKMLAPGLSERVFFIGHVSHQEMIAKYSEAHIFINASFYESFGMPVAEAMACGLPVIATRVGGVPEIVEDGVSGLLVQPGDPIGLGKAIELLIRDRGLRASVSAAGRQRVKDLFNWDRIAGTMAGYYRELAGE
ncbi:MAG: glycosyltransferase family 4 protein [Deltaproteobacteria bacterium]|nr:glycosyltransferase family 4 protein [Deltaproteobacteria bacterium]MBZ0219158.1 glycosyltransferase family 4 protein [Deltaproteobacteria bacterium]